ncbi:MAG: hypothetical protein ACOX6K_07735 [Sphaerochaetaceae bacterium]|jgi:hypothetical protein
MDDDTKKFLTELEQKHGGPVRWRTYATWYGNADGTLREYGVFLYVIGNRFYFEDFERVPSILGYALKPKKNAPPYVKYEGSFSADEIVRTQVVTKSLALDCIRGRGKSANIKEAGLIDKVFRQLVLLVETEEEGTFFLELMDRKGFLEEVEKIRRTGDAL